MQFVTGLEPGRDRLDRILELAARRQALGHDAPRPLTGRRIGALYLNPSLRTRASFAAALSSLGAEAVEIRPSDLWELESRDGVVMDGTRAEHARDAARVLSQYVDLLGVRSFSSMADPQSDLRDSVVNSFARHATVPVINLESGSGHPCQGLSDIFTMQRRLGSLQGVPLTIQWTPHTESGPRAIPNSVLKMACLMGMNVTVAHPVGWDLEEQVLTASTAIAARHGGSVSVSHDRQQAAAGARVLYACSWSGTGFYGRRVQETQARAMLTDWQVTQETMALTEGALLMHPLPVRRNLEVADAVLDGPSSLIYEQAGSRIHVQAALVMAMLGQAPGVGAW